MLNKEEILEINARLRKPFKNVTFKEKGHIYSVKGTKKPIKSVSSLVSFLHEPFPTDLIAPKYAKARNLDVEDVKLGWSGEGDISGAHGTKVHLIAEDYVRWKYFEECERPRPIDKQSLGAIQFINDLPDYLIPVALELIMFSALYWYVGTCDGVLYNTKTGKFIIYDYKTNKSLKDDGKPYLKYVDRGYGLRQDNFGKYTSQFSFYQILLEEAGFEVEARVLVWLREDEDKTKKKLYQTFKTKNITKDLRNFLDLKLHLK